MVLPRESTFLPTIKCSNCAQQVQLSLMGEHVCDAPAVPELSPSLQQKKTFGASHQAAQATRNKFLRTLPTLETEIETETTNGYSFLDCDSITPVSYTSASLYASPKTPSRSTPTTSASLNASPNLSSRSSPASLKSKYAPNVANSDHLQASPRRNPRRPGGYGGFGASSVQQDQDLKSTKAPDPSAKDGPSFFQRLNDMAGGYRGFGGQSQPTESIESRRVEEQSAPQQQQPQQQQQEPTSEPAGLFQRINQMATIALDAGRWPSAPPSKTDDSQRHVKEAQHDRDPIHSLAADPFSSRREHLRQKSHENSTEPLDDDRSRGMPRSETFPNGKRRPTSPYQQRPGHANPKPSIGPDTSRRPPPRIDLLKASHPMTSSVDLEVEFGIGNPYHTSTDSMSSGYSTMSERSTNPSSRGSTGPVAEPKKMDSMGRPGQQPARPLQQRSNNMNPAQRRDDARSNLSSDPAIQAPIASPFGLAKPSYSVSAARDGRYDPAIQMGKPTGLGGAAGRRYDDSLLQASNGGYAGSRLGPTATPLHQDSQDASLSSSRGNCKACRNPITGKSISSADGRLTGKYHKACFVCTTCTQPFASAEFYVHRDRPYCKMHYHKLNGSLCGSCQRGIEGQYLEDEARVKYHPGCFCCLDCGSSLTDGYFDVDGKSYCERDAWRRVQKAEKERDEGENGSRYKQQQQQQQQKDLRPPPKGQYVNLMSSRGRGTGPRNGAGMERGPYGVAPGSRDKFRMNKRMTRIGVM